MSQATGFLLTMSALAAAFGLFMYFKYIYRRHS